ncbi:MAG: hypothetical protein JO342_10310 [Solirubrobacterales bacterium]|nr:hypothetical protein [Solirubrobacterales bacterium]
MFIGVTKVVERARELRNAGATDRWPLWYAPGIVAPGSRTNSVETTQIAPTILHLLGLDPNELQAVKIEGTKILPGS